MRNSRLPRLVGAAVLATATLLSLSTSANAWAGLSDKQKAHIEEFIHCNTLMWTDLAQFEAEQPPCGGNPNPGLKSISSMGDGGGYIYRRPSKPDCEQPSGTMAAALVEIPVCELD
jgi:hypothetical protein